MMDIETLESVTIAQANAADRQRLRDLAGQSAAADALYLELVFGEKWVRFDISAIEATYLTPSELFARYFTRALHDLGLERPAETAAPSSDTPVSEE